MRGTAISSKGNDKKGVFTGVELRKGSPSKVIIEDNPDCVSLGTLCSFSSAEEDSDS